MIQPDTVAGMVLPVARTRDEAHLYMDLNPCATCAGSDVRWQGTLAVDGGIPVRRYSGVCPGCGARREFVFRLPEQPLAAGAGDVVLFGGADRSQLLDAGEWLGVADLCARAAAGDGYGEDGEPVFPPEALESLAIAVAAMNEVLKFIPEGAEDVPADAVWSERGRDVRESEPDRFRRKRLQLVRDTYRDVLYRAAP